ncbi:MAG: nitroreductase family protein [Firmicutes bacterium]|nr:nitroreductase family protein [Bacillota bacterium]
MMKFEVDAGKCIKCGLCATDCPFGIITPPDGENPPGVVAERAAYCIKCGHCQAVCPTGASSLGYDGVSLSKYTTDKLFVDPRQLANHMRLRRSVRKYKEEPVSKELLEELLDTARYAPSGTNRQPVGWIITYGHYKVHKLAEAVINWMASEMNKDSYYAKVLPIAAFVRAWEKGIDTIFHHAPHVITAYAHKDNHIAGVDCAIALTWLDLLMPSHGIGVCWAGLFELAMMHDPEMRKMLGVPEDHVTKGTLIFGYPKFKYNQIPGRNLAKIIWNED